MEKFQTFFPFSPTGPSCTYNFIADNPRGFLGLSTENQLPPTSTEVNKDNSNDSPMKSASGTEGEVLKQKKKKGEKKMRKPKHAFQTRSPVDILDDGYRWRKYGQKAVKNNKFPRSYYRCTHQGCNVKKQVQRLTKDEGVVVTTYEGMHIHHTENSPDNFEHILCQMPTYTPF